MDPNAALANAREALSAFRQAESTDEEFEPSDDLAGAFEALDEWLTKGGFLPDAWAWNSTVEFGGRRIGFAGGESLFVQIDGLDVIVIREQDGTFFAEFVPAWSESPSEDTQQTLWPPHPNRMDLRCELGRLVEQERLDAGDPTYASVYDNNDRFVAVEARRSDVAEHYFFGDSTLAELEQQLNDAEVNPNQIVTIVDLATGKRYGPRVQITLEA